MSEQVSTDPYKGVRDFYPDDWARLSAVFIKTRETLKKSGYEEYNASPLERAELYEAKTSEEIVNEQTYTFTDRGDRRVTLRPEMTPTLARMVAAKRRELTFPLRWFSIGNRFRYERPQKGRLREFYQADVDLIGLLEGEADIEVIKLAYSLLINLGATNDDFIIRINSRALLNAACSAAGLNNAEVKAYIHLLDKKSKVTSEEFEAKSKAISSSDPLSYVENASDTVVAVEKKKVTELIDALKMRGVQNAVFDASITRGFDYYTGIVFEIFDTNQANPRALFGGGRYDRLLEMFGEESIPAVGFALGDVTMLDFLETHGIALDTGTLRPQLFIGTPNVENIPAAQTFADELRTKGAKVFVNLTDKSLGDQIKDAVRRKIPLFIAYGADEQESGSVKLKTLETGEEELIHSSKLAVKLAAQ